VVVEGKVRFDFPGMNDTLREFMSDRIGYYFRDVRGFAYDEVRACMAAGWGDLLDLENRLQRVQAIRPTPDFEPIAASFKRIKNILEQAKFTKAGELRANLLEAGPEQELYNEIRQGEGQPLESRIGPLRPKVDLFFDKVLVNAPDEAVRRNRLTLLHNLLTEFSEIADFSEIVSQTNEPKN
jgi:glycyl-tRNA synthetase beta chain